MHSACNVPTHNRNKLHTDLLLSANNGDECHSADQIRKCITKGGQCFILTGAFVVVNRAET
jgi:hypothetical protein